MNSGLGGWRALPPLDDPSPQGLPAGPLFRLLVTTPLGTTHPGTAFLVGPYTLVTAAHVVLSASAAGMVPASSVEVVLDSGVTIACAQAAVPLAYVDSGGATQAADVAVLVTALPAAGPPYLELDPPGIGTPPVSAVLYGYPAYAPLEQLGVLGERPSGPVRYLCGNLPGCSGAPVVRAHTHKVIGVHRYFDGAFGLAVPLTEAEVRAALAQLGYTEATS